MVERNRVERAEARQVVLIRRVVAVPGHHVEGREGLRMPRKAYPGLARSCQALLVRRAVAVPYHHEACGPPARGSGWVKAMT